MKQHLHSHLDCSDLEFCKQLSQLLQQLDASYFTLGSSEYNPLLNGMLSCEIFVDEQRSIIVICHGEITAELWWADCSL